MRDRPVQPLDNAIYWIEYVARFEGAPHLRYPGIDLSWYQRCLLDIIGFIILTSFVIIWAIIVFVKKFAKICTPKLNKQKNKSN